MPHNPVPEFLWAGLSVFYQHFPLQGFLLERFKRRLYCRQLFRRESRPFLRFVQNIAPALAFVLVLVVVVVVLGSLVKLPLVLEGLLFSAFVAAQSIAQAFGEKNLAADFALAEVQPPVRKPVHVVDQQRIKRMVGGYTLGHFFPVRIPEVKPERLSRYPPPHPPGQVKADGLAGIFVKIQRAVRVESNGQGRHFLKEPLTGGVPFPGQPCFQIFIPDTESGIHPHRIAVCVLFRKEAAGGLFQLRLLSAVGVQGIVEGHYPKFIPASLHIVF